MIFIIKANNGAFLDNSVEFGHNYHLYTTTIYTFPSYILNLITRKTLRLDEVRYLCSGTLAFAGKIKTSALAGVGKMGFICNIRRWEGAFLISNFVYDTLVIAYRHSILVRHFALSDNPIR